MNAPEAAIARVQKVLGCRRIGATAGDWQAFGSPICFLHSDDAGWTDRGCPVAVAAADAAVAPIAAQTLRDAAADEALADCVCGHTLDTHNGLGCYARLSYTPLVKCDCVLTDERTDADLVALNLRDRADRIEADQ